MPCAFASLIAFFSKSANGIDRYFLRSPPSGFFSSLVSSFVAAACASPLPARPFCKTAFNCAISSSLSSVPSSEVSMMLVRYPSNASRHLNTISTRSALTFIFPFRISENTFSISCVKRCIRLYPIVPAIPFNEWAALKISFTVSTFSGSDSNIST